MRNQPPRLEYQMYGYIRVREGPRHWVDISGTYRTREAAISKWVYYMMIAEHVTPLSMLIERKHTVEFKPRRYGEPCRPMTYEKIIYRAPLSTPGDLT